MSNKTPKLDPQNVEDIISLTPLQEGMLFHYLSNPETPVYFEQLSLSLSGLLDPLIFRNTWELLIETNEILRAVFRWEKVEQPVQIILKKKALPLHEIDLSGANRQELADLLNDVKRKDREQRLDLTVEPFRLTLCKLDQQHHQLIISSHHILYDGWSNGIILTEFLTTYESLVAGRPPVKPVKPKFKDFIKQLRSNDRERQLTYWKEYLQGFGAKTGLPADTKKFSEISELATYTCRLPAELTARVDSFVKDRGVTLATLLYGVWGILLQCYNDSDDVAFGTTIAGREAVLPGIEAQVGLFINTIPLRFKFDPGLEVAVALNRLGSELQQRAEHEMAALTDIKSCSELDQQEALFDSIVVVDNYPLAANLSRTPESGGSIRIEAYSIFEMTNYDLTLQIFTFGPLELQFNYNGALFDPETIRRMATHFQNVLLTICRQPQLKLQELDLLSGSEKHQLMYEFNNTTVAYPKNRLIPQLIAEHAAKTPDRTAVIYEEQQLTYRELNLRANQVAELLQSYGIKSGAMVGLLMPRSMAMIVGLLGILKANAICVPLDVEHPAERIRTILEDSGASVVLQLAGHDYLPEFDGIKPEVDWLKLAIYPGLEPEVRISPDDDLAYLIYTSGSTGTPKGAMLTHAGIINHVLTKIEVLEVDARDIIGNNFSINVIAAVWQILAPLFCGSKLIVYEEAVEKDPYLQFEKVAVDRVSIIEVIPSVLNAYLDIIAMGKSKIPLPQLRKIALTSEETKTFLVNKFYRQYQIPLVDCYGQTECSDDTLHYRIPFSTETTLVPIGRPSHNTRIYILSRHNQLQPIGIAGELCVSGDGVGRGYWNKPELTAAKFMPNPFESGQIMYRTGDLARWCPDGLVAYLGRIDHQVKIRGNRIELGEIESQLLKHPAIQAAVVVAREDASGDPFLAAFFVAVSELSVAELRGFLAQVIPDYMIPAQFVRLDQMPLTPNGKIDRKRLPQSNSNIAIGNQFVPPDTVVEKQLAAIWQQILHTDSLGIHDNFFDRGGHSLLLIQVRNKIQELFHQEIPVVEMFRCPTIHLLADYLNSRATPASSPQSSGSSPVTGASGPRNNDDPAVAIIGMAGYFPGAATIEAFWNNLMQGRETVSRFTDAELDHTALVGNDWEDPLYVKANGILEGIDRFDAGFFGFTPREAELTDPQQRQFLKCAWEALEDAGYNPDHYPGKIGVYAGVGTNTYLIRNLLPERDLIRVAGDFQTVMGNDKDFVATRVCYKLNLKGPGVSVQTACSTSMVAVHLARRGLLHNECQMALAGAAFIRIPQKTGYLYQEGGNLSPDGHCRTFDQSAQGTVFGNGVGVVVLKRLTDACRDGDRIYAVIKGSAINNDGALKVSYTAPGVDGQAEVIAQALADSGINPETISYIEAHGTATTLGDPIEIAALTKAFRHNTARKTFCAIGTVKTNIGHLDVAAGIAGLIKTALALHHQTIPPSLHFARPNPVIDLADSPFYVNDRPRAWEADNGPRRAGVSCFGIGGTNVHLVLEEAPELETSAPVRSGYILPLSAKTAAALETMTRNLAVWLETNPELHLADVSYTLQVGRREFQYRRAIVCEDRDEAIRLLTELKPDPALTGNAIASPPHLIFNCDHPAEIAWNALRELYRQEPVFRKYLDLNSGLLQAQTRLDLTALMQDAVRLDSGFSNQPSIVASIWLVIQAAVIQVLQEWGIVPRAILGYRASELSAACLAGVFSLEDAIAVLNLPEPEQIESLLRRIQLHPPRIPFRSKLAGSWIQPAEAAKAEYWIALFRRKEWMTPDQFKGAAITIEPDALLLAVVNEVDATITVPETTVEFPRQVALWPPPGRKNTASLWLKLLGKLWSFGIPVDWNGFYGPEQRRRVSLPSYPFEEERFWIESPGRNSSGPVEHYSVMVKESDPGQWFYLPVWRQAPLIMPVLPPEDIQPGSVWLLFMDPLGLGEELGRALRLQNQTVITVTAALQFAKTGSGSYRLNPRQPEHYQCLLRELNHGRQLPERIIHLWNITEPVQSETGFTKFLDDQYLGFYSLIFLAQGWVQQAGPPKVSLLAVSNGTYDLDGIEAYQPGKTTVWGASMVITQEYPSVRCRCLDLSNSDLHHDHLAGLVKQILQEILFSRTEGRIAYHRGQRWTRAYEKAGLSDSGPASASMLRHRGVYLLTGGLGKMGLTIAEYLAGTAQAKLILAGRSNFPDREQWDDWLMHHDPDDSCSLKISQIIRMEALGSEIMVIKGDVADPDAVQEIVDKGKTRFGAIHGVIHAAGFTGATAVTLVAETTVQTSERQFLPKIKGLMNLAAVFEQEPLDFWILASSIASVLGGLGSAAYTAANIFMDEFARKQSQSGHGRLISINWDAWRFDTAKTGGSALERLMMDAGEGIDILERILAREGFTQLVISTGDLNRRLRQSFPGPAVTARQELSGPLPISGHHRPELQTDYRPAGNQVEALLCEVWEELIGVRPVGVLDNFFELGGHSLMATRVISRIKDIFRVEISIRRFFDAPSIKELALEITKLWGGLEQAGEVAGTYLQLKDLSAADIRKMLDN